MISSYIYLPKNRPFSSFIDICQIVSFGSSNRASRPRALVPTGPGGAEFLGLAGKCLCHCGAGAASLWKAGL